MAAARTLGPGWQGRFRALAEYCQQRGRPRRDYIEVLGILVGYASLVGGAAFEDFEAVRTYLDQAAHDAGLDIYATLTELSDAERLGKALELAQQRFETAPVRERVWSPGEAIPLLAMNTGSDR